MTEYLFDKEQYLKTKQAWKALGRTTARDVIIYNFLRTKPILHGFQTRGGVWERQAIDLYHHFNYGIPSTVSYIQEAREKRVNGALADIKARFDVEFTLEHAALFCKAIEEARRG